MRSPILASVLLAALAAGPAHALKLTLNAETTFPAVMVVDGQVIGHAADKVHEIMRRTGTEYSMAVLPWKRAYTQARLQANTCVFMTARTAERESLFRWVGPISDSDWVLFGRADRRYAIKTLEDARPLRIGAYNGDVRGDYLAKQGFNVDFVQHDTANPQKLLLNRIDLWVNSTRSATPMLEEASLSDKIVPVLVFDRAKLYLACHPGLDAALAARMDEAVRAMQADGTFKALEKKYAHLKPTKAPKK